MNETKGWSDSDNIVAKILKGENRFYQEVTITKVNGECPYGHREGEQFQVTALNSDGLCGSLYKAIHSPIVTLHYGGISSGSPRKIALPEYALKWVRSAYR